MHSYNYSFTSTKIEALSEFEAEVQLMFRPSPVTMVIIKDPQPIGKLLIRLCAIVGGVFVIFGIVNRVTEKLKKAVREELASGEH